MRQNIDGFLHGAYICRVIGKLQADRNVVDVRVARRAACHRAVHGDKDHQSKPQELCGRLFHKGS